VSAPLRGAALLALAAALLLAPAVFAQTAPSYGLFYGVRIEPTQRIARVSIRIEQGQPLVKRIRLRIDPQRHFDFSADGSTALEDGLLLWRPPSTGGTLRYRFRIDHLRDSASYDARCAENWAIFRGDDLVPPAHVWSEVGSQSRARLRIVVPEGWSAVARFARGADGSFVIDDPQRRFDRPTGWIAAGKLGVLRERVAGTRVAIAGPVGQGLRRHDLLAMLRWTLPVMRKVVGELPERLLVVGAGDPMWRGGLSGPSSLFVHASRPLITPDLTSPLLHELVHTVLAIRAGPGGDWIVEGLAEYYALELVRRSKTVSRTRYEKALQRLAARGRGAPLEVERAEGAVTARAVTVLHALDAELRRVSEGAVSLDAVADRLAGSRERVTTQRLRELCEELTGRELGAFFRSQVPARRQRQAKTG
jgi:hypothetical protein